MLSMGSNEATQEAQMLALSEADAFSAGVTPGALEPERYRELVALRANRIEIRHRGAR